MCEFCENIARDDNEYFEKRVKGGDFIFQDDDGFSILIDTGDSGCLGVLNNIVACPKCGRDLRCKFDEQKNNPNCEDCKYIEED